MAQAARNVDAERACGIVFLRPYDVSSSRPFDTHPGKTLHADPANDQKYEARFNKWFSGEVYPVIGIRHLHNILCLKADEGRVFAIRGGLKHPGARFHRRTKSDRGGTAIQGITVEDRRWVALDVDKLPNPKKHDPRRDPEAAARWVRSLLPGDLSQATVSVAWSSSCCARTPAGVAPRTLSCRLWFWLVDPLSEQDARRLMRLASAEVVSALAAEGEDCPPKVVDPSVATANTAIYIVPPVFAGGLSDPLPNRQLLLEGEFDVADVAPLLAQSVMPVVARAQRAAAARPRTDRKAAPALPVMPVVPLSAATRLLAAMQEAAGRRERRASGYREACFAVFRHRWPLEIVAGVLWCRGRGEMGDERYSEWLHGVPEGLRNDFALLVSSGVVAALPTGLGADKVRGKVREYLRLMVSEAWIDAEWQGTADRSVISRYEAAPELGEATLEGTRYTYSQRGILEVLDGWVTDEMVQALGLRSICSDAARLRAQRAGDSAPRLAARAIRDAEVVRLSLAGMTVRQIAAQTGVSRSTVHRAVAAYAKKAWHRAVAAQRAALDTKRAANRTDAAAEAAEALVAERKAAMRDARQALKDLAKVSGLTVQELQGHLADWLQEERQRLAA